MTLLIQNIRRQEKLSTVELQLPTVPTTNDHTDGTWLVTDIYEAEIFVNTKDKIAYSRSHDGDIFKIGAYIPSDLPFVPTDAGDWDTLPLDVEDALNILATSIVAPSLQGLKSVLGQSNITDGENIKITGGDKILFGNSAFLQEGIANIFNDTGFLFDYRGANKSTFFYFSDGHGLSVRKGFLKSQDLDIETYGGASSVIKLGSSSTLLFGSTGTNRLIVNRESSDELVTATIQGASGTIAYLSDIEAFFDTIDPLDLNFITDDIPEDADPVNLWFTQDRTRLTSLQGLTAAPIPLEAINDGDTILQAFSKIQAQINAFVSSTGAGPLNDTLLLGNETLGNDIIISNGDIVNFAEIQFGQDLIILPEGGRIAHIANGLIRVVTNGITYENVLGQPISTLHSNGRLEVGSGSIDGTIRIHDSSNNFYYDVLIPNALANRTMVLPDGDIDWTGGTLGDVMTLQADGSYAPQTFTGSVSGSSSTRMDYTWTLGDGTIQNQFDIVDKGNGRVQFRLSEVSLNAALQTNGDNAASFFIDRSGHIEITNLTTGVVRICQVWTESGGFQGVGNKFTSPSFGNIQEDLFSLFNTVGGDYRFMFFSGEGESINIGRGFFGEITSGSIDFNPISTRNFRVYGDSYIPDFEFVGGYVKFNQAVDKFGEITGKVSTYNAVYNKNELQLSATDLENMHGIPMTDWCYDTNGEDDQAAFFVNGIRYPVWQISVFNDPTGLVILHLDFEIDISDIIQVAYRTIAYYPA